MPRLVWLSPPRACGGPGVSVKDENSGQGTKHLRSSHARELRPRPFSMARQPRARPGPPLFCVLALLHSSSLALRPTPLRPSALRRAWAPRAVATVEATDHPLEAIRAAPAHADSLESASVAGPLNDAPWRHAFRALATDPAFVSAGFGKAAFKLDERWDFAVGSVTMEDVERDVTLMPPQFVASGVRYQGGIYNQPFTAGFTFADVDARMDSATVVLLNAGFLIPKLAAISLAMLEATRLPIWMNVTRTRP